jgi:hypothetical protein
MLYNFLRPQVTNFLNRLEAFVPGKLFQPSLMFVGKARTLEWSTRVLTAVKSFVSFYKVNKCIHGKLYKYDI